MTHLIREPSKFYVFSIGPTKLGTIFFLVKFFDEFAIILDAINLADQMGNGCPGEANLGPTYKHFEQFFRSLTP